MRNEPGFSLVEAVIAMALSLIVLLGLYAAYAHGTEVKMRVQGSVKIESNVRLAMDRMSRDLRVAGFAVPEGTVIGVADAHRRRCGVSCGGDCQPIQRHLPQADIVFGEVNVAGALRVDGVGQQPSATVAAVTDAHRHARQPRPGRRG